MKLTQALSALALAVVVSVGAAPAARSADDTIRVATDATFPPLEFVKDGKRTGFDIELIEAMAKTMGKKVQWVDIDSRA
jgi:polar amino acid transport system substrate-binding protein